LFSLTFVHFRSKSFIEADTSTMDYTMEDIQNAAPEAHATSKLGASTQRSDNQSVTKRFVVQPSFVAGVPFCEEDR
jgi:hypothetical protein